MLNNDVLNLVNLRLSLDGSEDPIVETYVTEVINRVKLYCNLNTVPVELTYTLASMVIELLQAEAAYIPSIASTIESEIRLGDATIKMGQPRKTIETIVSNFAIDLNSYRKLRW